MPSGRKRPVVEAHGWLAASLGGLVQPNPLLVLCVFWVLPLGDVLGHLPGALEQSDEKETGEEASKSTKTES